MQNQSIYVLGCIYFILAVIYTTIEVIYIYKHKKLKILTCIRGMYCVIYGYTPWILHTYIYRNGSYEFPYSLINYSDEGIALLYILMILSIIGYMAINYGYFISVLGKKKINKVFCRVMKDRHFFIAGLIMLMIGVTSLLLWTKAYGGPIKVLEYADILRAGLMNTYNPWSILMRFCPLNSFATYIFITLWIKNKYSIKYLVFVILGIIPTILYNLASSSRLQFVLFFALTFIIASESKKIYEGKKIKFNRYIILGFTAIILMSSAEPIMRMLQTGNAQIEISYNINILEVLREEFFFPTVSGQTAIEAHNAGIESFRFIKDLISGLLAWLPSRFRPESIQQLEVVNTYLAMGTNLYGYLPPDLISVSIYALGYFGVIIIPAILGLIARKVDSYYDRIAENNYTIIIKVLISFYFIKAVAYSDFANIMANVFFIVLGVVIIKIVSKIIK